MDFLKTMFEGDAGGFSIVKKALGKSIADLQNRKQRPADTLLLVNGQSTDGGKMFAYVLVEGHKVDAFLEAQSKAPFYPDQFGKIIESGYGTPSEELRKRMESEYGFRHEDMESK